MHQILKDTLDLLRNRPRHITYKQIEADTGLSERWLTYLAAGEVKDPGILKLEKLRSYLLTRTKTISA